MKKTLKRIAVGVAALSVLCAVPFMAGCDSSHPEAQITISYDGTEYVLNYKLYRNMYPQTVQHFIELADAGFYNNTIIHSYESSYFYGGGYSYNIEGYESDYATDYEEGEGAMREYFEANSKENAYYQMYLNNQLTPSVARDWTEDRGYIDWLPTVIGEVGETHVIQNGALTGGFGALRMYYSDKDLDYVQEQAEKAGKPASVEVYIDKQDSPDGICVNYEQHSATSMFSIQTSTSSGSSDYCIFGQLIETDSLTELTSAISEGSTLSVRNVTIDNYDQITSGYITNTDEYTVTSIPIIVVSVEITKY